MTEQGPEYMDELLVKYVTYGILAIEALDKKDDLKLDYLLCWLAYDASRLPPQSL